MKRPARSPPERLGRCRDCGAAYPVRETADGWKPVGTNGQCRCGNDSFDALTAR